MNEKTFNFKLKRNFNKETPSWQSILENYNWSLTNKKSVKHICPGFFASHEAHLIKEVKLSLQKRNCKIAHLYINTCVGPTFGKHKDETDVHFWQVQGITHWIIDNNTIILSPGDLLIIKKQVYHEVVPQTPRAGISMSKI